jgi:hypothetical protein
MLDVREQLRGYGEQLDLEMSPVRPNEITAPGPTRELPLRRLTPQRPRPGWVYALIAAAAVLLVIGGTAWLLRGGDTVEQTPVTAPPEPPGPPPSTIPVSDALFPITLGDETIAGLWDLFGMGDDPGFRWEMISIADPTLLAEGVALVMHPGFLAVVNGMAAGSDVWISGDGELWEPVTMPGTVDANGNVTATVADITVAGPGLVAVGWEEPRPACDNFDDPGCVPQGTQQGIVWTSEDGRAWTRLSDSEVFAGADVHSVASDGTSLVAVGFHHDSGLRGDPMAGRSVVWTSLNGIEWTQVADDQVFSDSTMYEVVHGPGGYLVVGLVQTEDVDVAGGESIYWLSPDGHEWSRVAIPSGLRETTPYALAVGDNGYSSEVWTRGNRVNWVSPDGITWQLAPVEDPAIEELGVSEALSATQIAFHSVAFDEGEGVQVEGEGAFDEGGGAEHNDIFVMNIDGSGTTRLHQTVTGIQTLTEDLDADWSPDGTKIVFTSLRDEVDFDWNWEIYVMNADGSDQRRLTDSPGSDAFPDWSPDGTRIAFERDGPNGPRDIWVMNADGSGQINLTGDPDHQYLAPAWSPDGSRIAFSSNRDAPLDECANRCTRDIYVMNGDGSNIVRLTETSTNDSFPEWSPDGTLLLFHGSEMEVRDGDHWVGKNWEVFLIDAGGSDPVNLTNDPAMDAHPVWAPDGTLIAFNSTRDGNVEIYLMDPEGGNVTRITDTSSLEEWRPSWSPLP